MKKLFRRLLARYIIVAYFDGKSATHLAFWRDDVTEWLRCYPAEDAVFVYECFLGIRARSPIYTRGL